MLMCYLNLLKIRPYPLSLGMQYSVVTADQGCSTEMEKKIFDEIFLHAPIVYSTCLQCVIHYFVVASEI